MKALLAWGEGRQKTVAMFAQWVAASAQAVYEVLRDFEKLSLVWQSREICPGLDSWLLLYRQQYRVTAVGLELVLDPGRTDDRGMTFECGDCLASLASSHCSDVIRDVLLWRFQTKELSKVRRRLGLVYRLVHVPALRRMMMDAEQSSAELSHWISQPEILFWLTVAMPCWLRFQESPWSLYAMAEKYGKFETLEKLAQLDSRIIHDRGVGQQIDRLRQQHAEQHQMILQAASARSRQEITLKQVKFLLGGFLIHFSEQMDLMARQEFLHNAYLQHAKPGYEDEVRLAVKERRRWFARIGTGCLLKPTDIKTLFDAIAKDTIGSLVDDDFVMKPNALQKRLRRNAEPWAKLGQSDILRAA